MTTHEQNTIDKVYDGGFDGNHKFWSAAPNQAVNDHVTVDLGHAYDLTEIKFYFCGGDQPLGGNVEVSTDNSSWETVKSFTQSEIGDASTNYLYSCSATGKTARYVRFLNTNPNTGWFQMAEIEVYGKVPASGSVTPHVYGGDFTDFKSAGQSDNAHTSYLSSITLQSGGNTLYSESGFSATQQGYTEYAPITVNGNTLNLNATITAKDNGQWTCVYVFADLDCDGDFEDTNERLYSGYGSGSLAKHIPNTTTYPHVEQIMGNKTIEEAITFLKTGASCIRIFTIGEWDSDNSRWFDIYNKGYGSNMHDGGANCSTEGSTTVNCNFYHCYDFPLMVSSEVDPVTYTYCTSTKTNDSSFDRYTRVVSLTGSKSGTWTSGELQTAKGQALNFNKTTDTEIMVKAGETLTPSLEFHGSWMHKFVYIDLNRDGDFTDENERISYTYLDGKNMAGETYEGEESGNQLADPPAFTAPTEGGRYRIRFMIDWGGDNR